MKKVILGDSLEFKTTVHDTDGTAIESAAVTLTVTDASGSQVLSAGITHSASGTYGSAFSTTGWGTGPIRQNWLVTDTSGTRQNILENKVKIVNTATAFPTYVYVDELEQWFPSISDYLDDKSEDHVISAYKYENRMIETLGHATPRNKNSDGFYDQSVRDFNAWNAIYRIVAANQMNQVPSDENGRFWFDGFNENAMKVWQDWKSKKITFKDQISPGEAGIKPPTRTAGSSVGTMFNNSEETFGSGFQGSDFKRTWSVEITGTGTAGELRECGFKWSNDGGLGTATGTTSDSWLHLQDQVYIRFTRGTHTGTTGIFVVGDKWEFETNPVRYQVGGKGVAKGY